MTERLFFDGLLIVFAVAAVATFPALYFITAPYGRHGDGRGGPRMSATAGWILMEAPSPIVLALCFVLAPPAGAAPWVFFALWQAHYLHRAFVFPLRRHRSARTMPVSIALGALAFNLCNGYLNGRWLTVFGPELPADWLVSWPFIAGVLLFCAGFAINFHADEVLLRLRKPGETGYRIPHGGLYRWITCPNYLGEILEWVGFALATWSLPALVFAVWTAANLVPRARTHHQWYREKFPDYPPGRRALVPGIY